MKSKINPIITEFDGGNSIDFGQEVIDLQKHEDTLIATLKDGTIMKSKDGNTFKEIKEVPNE